MSTKGRWGNPAIEWDPLPYMQEFLNELEGQLRSPDYVRKVKLGLAHFALFCREERITHPEELKRDHLLRFQSKVNRNPDWTKSYQQQLMKYLRSWVNWLEEVRYITESPWYRIRVGRVEKKPNPLSDDEVDSLFDAHRRQAFSISPFAFHRRETILTLLYSWGLRIHELRALNVSSMDLRLDYVTAPNKGGGTKSLPYPEVMKQVMRRWFAVRSRYAAIGEDALLIDQQGSRLSTDMVYKIITELGKRAGISVHPHQLRDTCGTHLLDSDVEVERVMRIMGHTNVRQTLAYSKVNNRKVAEAHDRAMTPRIERLLNIQNTRDID
jgi:site-specific recombinase XerD